MIFDTLENLEMYTPVIPHLDAVIKAMDHDDIYDREVGSYRTLDPKVVYNVSETVTTNADKPFEFHKNHTDVQIVLSGNELMSTSWRELQREASSYDKEKDMGLVDKGEALSVILASQGRFVVFFPGELHKCAVANGEECKVKKVIFKIED